MPRPKNSILHDFYDQNDETTMVCNTENCNGKVLNSHSANLERHLKLVHPDSYSYYEYLKSVKKKKKKRTPKAWKPQFTGNLNPDNIELAIVDFFTKNGRPLHMIEDRAFKILVQPAFDALGISFNEQSVNERIIAYVQKWKTEIIKELKGKLLSLKVDAVTRQDFSVLGINVQYLENKCIQIKTLAVKELKVTHTSEYLKSVILQVLTEYEIDIKQIFTITTDTGANLSKSVNDLNIDLQIPLGEEEEGDNDMSMDEIDVDLSLIEDKMESILHNLSSTTITGVHCGAHTLQLCVHEVIERTEIKSKLEKCRSVANTLNILKNNITDCATSWHSTFGMLERLSEIKDTIDPLQAENLSPDEWNFVNECIETLKPIHLATIKLQSEQLYLSDLYIVIMDILFQVEGLPDSEMKTLVVDSMNKQKSKLFAMDLFNAAIFLDPRIKICLNVKQEEIAKKYITSLFKRMSSLNGSTCETTERPIKHENVEEPSTSNRLSKSFTEYLLNLDPGSHESSTPLHRNLEKDFTMYERQPRLPLELNLIDFWSFKNNWLSAMAEIILAIPSTQASVGRLFLALKHISADQRNSPTTCDVEHILMVHVNGVFNYED